MSSIIEEQRYWEIIENSGKGKHNKGLGYTHWATCSHKEDWDKSGGVKAATYLPQQIFSKIAVFFSQETFVKWLSEWMIEYVNECCDWDEVSLFKSSDLNC